jgi:hypothetical protein
VSASVRYAAAYAYSPRGQSEVSVNSRKVRDLVKSADPAALKSVSKRVLEMIGSGLLPGFFGPEVTLVPIPGTRPHLGIRGPMGTRPDLPGVAAGGVGA